MDLRGTIYQEGVIFKKNLRLQLRLQKDWAGRKSSVLVICMGRSLSVMSSVQCFESRVCFDSLSLLVLCTLGFSLSSAPPETLLSCELKSFHPLSPVQTSFPII